MILSVPRFIFAFENYYTKKENPIMAIHGKKSAVAKVQQLAERSKGMVEFVIKVDMNLDSPYLCSGAIINVDQGSGTLLPIIVVNMKEYSPFFSIEQLEQIRDAIGRNDKNTKDDIAKVCPSAVVSTVLEGVTTAMLMNPDSGAQLIAMFMYEAFMTGAFSRLRGSKVDIRNLAARTHVYFNQYPAGSGAGTTIKMVSTSQIPHVVTFMKSSDVLQLVCLNEATKDITVSMKNSDGAINKIVVEPDLINFLDESIDKKSRIATSFFDLIVLFEKLRNQIDSSEKKHNEEIASLKNKLKDLKKKK